MRFGWLKRLSGQLVLSHVFVAVVVLAFALGVAQLTFRHYLAVTQLTQLSEQGQVIARNVGPQYFSGTMPDYVAKDYIHILQGALKAQVTLVSDTGQVELPPTGNIQFQAVGIPESALARVAEQGQVYRGIVDNVAIVGVPVKAGPSYLGPSYGPNILGAVFVESPLSISQGTANTLTRLLLLGELVAVIMVGALAYAISWRLSRPLQELRRVVAGTGRADDAPRVPAAEDQGPLEVQELAREFNRLEDRIQAQVGQLKREAEARDALLAHVAHDLRTPLTSIRGFLEAVKDGVATGDAGDRAVQVAWEETLRLQRLVNRLLRATRIRSESGTMVPLSLHQIVGKTMERVKPVMDEKDLKLVWSTQEDATVLANEDYLVEALVNVVDNAVKWSPEGGTITIETIRETSRAVVRVSDQGPGIPEELLPRVFERFVTGDASRQSSNGLGLFIVDEVMRHHRGGVDIHSTPGEGTTVELWLPCATG
ncbi:sensor histidine kinase [Sulfobacillus harzensis]|uniref:histidine kinase n=1 Tax=Sulfobacillus harzensis TaxID=2729629 RepID=A0A7Y0L0G2_9FIRM|nr:HAMP domain-containing sensor histidine kinase [Sulfobacillus harzensis]NMP21021.1 HAMP domain-containing histidine kinase [Sulfobacillus harzensis]